MIKFTQARQNVTGPCKVRSISERWSQPQSREDFGRRLELVRTVCQRSQLSGPTNDISKMRRNQSC